MIYYKNMSIHTIKFCYRDRKKSLSGRSLAMSGLEVPWEYISTAVLVVVANLVLNKLALPNLSEPDPRSIQIP
jgi:hypothetical protein